MSDNIEYDEDKAVAHIRSYLPIEIKDKYTDDDILIVIDTIFDYYESNGFFDLSSDVNDEEDIDVPKLVKYVQAQIKKDKDNAVALDDVEAIVLGELDYEETLGIF